MRVFLEIAHTGVVAVFLYPLRNLVTVFCLLVVLVPFLSGIGISQAIQSDAEISLECGADLYVSGEQFDRPHAIPWRAADRIREIDGVEQVIPRIVGNKSLGSNREQAVVVGMPAESFPDTVNCVNGRLFTAGSKAELVIGSDLARRLKLKPGDKIPPFYHSRQGESVSHVVGVFHSDVAMWQAHVIFTSLETAAEIFDQQGLATDLLVDCKEGYDASVYRQINQNISLQAAGSPLGVHIRCVTRQQLAAVLPTGLLRREGVFNIHFMLACVTGTLVILVTSGFGLSERRREIGILKALGWQTDEVLLRSLVESLLLSLLGAALAIVVTYLWLRGLNGFWVASVFLPGVDAYPSFRVPFRLTFMPALLACIFSVVMVLSGTLYATWSAATAAPKEAMR